LPPSVADTFTFGTNGGGGGESNGSNNGSSHGGNGGNGNNNTNNKNNNNNSYSGNEEGRVPASIILPIDDSGPLDAQWNGRFGNRKPKLLLTHTH
jgi:hypothetical protein